MPEQYMSPQQTVDYLNERLALDPPLNVKRLNTLKNGGHIKGQRVGNTNTTIYSKQTLDRLTTQDLRDHRKRS